MNNGPVTAASSIRYLSHAMLGLQRWIPRNFIDGDSGCVVNDTEKVSCKKTLHSLPATASANMKQESNPPVEDHRHAAIPLLLADGIELCGYGVLVSNEDFDVAWFLPLPWRQQDHVWAHWKDEDEGELLVGALRVTGAGKMLQLLEQYHNQPLAHSTLPGGEVVASALSLPDSVNIVLTFSGMTWQHLSGQEEAGDSSVMDWHGRQVQVRCLPHPYCCLIDPASKRALWQALIKLNYET